MDRAPESLDNLQALELRVLRGPQQGARAPLPAGSACVLATGDDGVGADIQLRGTAPARVRLQPQLTHALIEVQHGEVRIGGEVLGAGAQAVWKRHALLEIGGAVVAFGLACEDQWPALDADADADPDDAPLPAAAARRSPGRRAEVWLAATGAAVLLACAGSFWVVRSASATVAPPVATAPSFAETLARSEFAGLEALPGADGRLRITGRLATAADRARLDNWLAEKGVAAAVDVHVDEAIERELAELFRVNGVAVQARSAGGGRFVVEATERDADRLARAEEVVRRDVHGVTSLTVTNTAKPAPPPAVPLPEDPNKRIASIVPGEPAYVVTVDGARYFVGALLPSGHRITQVAAQAVTLERDGRHFTLNF